MLIILQEQLYLWPDHRLYRLFGYCSKFQLETFTSLKKYMLAKCSTPLGTAAWHDLLLCVKAQGLGCTTKRDDYIMEGKHLETEGSTN